MWFCSFYIKGVRDIEFWIVLIIENSKKSTKWKLLVSKFTHLGEKYKPHYLSIKEGCLFLLFSCWNLQNHSAPCCIPCSVGKLLMNKGAPRYLYWLNLQCKSYWIHLKTIHWKFNKIKTKNPRQIGMCFWYCWKAFS
jgi:hypothetical protein